MKIEFFGKRKIKDDTKKRKYIKDTEKDGKDFYENELIEEIRLAKLNFVELKEKSKRTFNPIITFLLSMLTILGSWIILYGNIYNGLSNLMDFVNKNNKAIEMSTDIIQSQTESLKVSLIGTVDLTSRIIIFGGIVISICSIFLVYELILKADTVDKIAKIELKIEIYTDILNNKQYKSENEVLSKDDSEEEAEVNKKTKFITKYGEKFDLLLSNYMKMNLTKERLEKEKCLINTEIERIKYYRPEHKKKDFFQEYMAGIAVVLAFYSLATSVLDKNEYQGIIYLLVFMATIGTFYALFRISDFYKKDEIKEKNVNNIINMEKELFINLNIEFQVIEYLLNSNKKTNELINNKDIIKEVAIGVDDKNK